MLIQKTPFSSLTVSSSFPHLFSLYSLTPMNHSCDLPVSLKINRLGALCCLQCDNVAIHVSSCQCFHLVKPFSHTYTYSVCYRVNTINWSVTGCERTVFTMYNMSSSRNTYSAGKMYSPVQYCVGFAQSYVS